MKKIIMTIAAMTTVAVVNAASVTWSGNSGALSSLNATAADYSIYLIDASVYSYSTALTDLAAGNFNAGSSAILRETAGIAVVANNTFRWNETKQTQLSGTTAYSAGDSVSAYAIILNGSASDFTEYMVTKVMEDATVSDAGLVSFGFGNQSTAGANTGWQAVPEPTSGLLLLLGVAGLALRRKRA